MEIKIGILTVSDRCSRGERADQSGPALQKAIKAVGWKIERTAIVPDEADVIEAVLVNWVDDKKHDLIFTVGGTGLGPRDVTPEATRKVIERELPGLPEFIRREGSKRTPLAVLSRALAGSRNQTLIINLPGSPKGAVESFEVVVGLIPHALAMLQGEGHESSTCRGPGDSGSSETSAHAKGWRLEAC